MLLPVFLLPARMLGARLQQVTRESYGLDAQMNATMSERFNVAGALLVKLYGRPEREAAAFRDKAGRVRDIGVISAMYSRIFFVALSLVAALATAITYGMGGVLAAQRTLEIGTLVALTAYLARLYGPLTALSNVRVDVMTALVSFERVFEVLDLPPAIADKPGAVELPRTAATIEFDEVDFRYPSAEEVSLASLESVAVLDKKIPQQVLHGVSFSARPGELVALVGPSGAGKTTISQLVTRMYDVQAGSVQVGGLDVRDVTLQSLRDAVGVVTQDPHMFHATIGENLRHARDGATDEQLWAALDAAQVGDLVREPSRRAGHRCRRARLPALRRGEATHCDRPGAAQGAGDRGARRGDGAPGQRIGTGRSACPGDRTARAYLAGDSAPALDDPGRRPHPGRGRRAGRGQREA